MARTTKVTEWQVRPLDEFGDATDVLVFDTYAAALVACLAESPGAVAAVLEQVVDEFDGDELVDREFSHWFTSSNGLEGYHAVRRWKGEEPVPMDDSVHEEALAEDAGRTVSAV